MSRVAPPADLAERSLWAFILVLVVTCLILSIAIEPASRGHGTHEQLGLPPCGIALAFDVPCPSCGYTTSWAHAIRFQWLQAVLNQPFGFLLFLLSWTILPFAGQGAIAGKSYFHAWRSWPWRWIGLVTFLLWLASWAYKWYTW